MSPELICLVAIAMVCLTIIIIVWLIVKENHKILEERHKNEELMCKYNYVNYILKKVLKVEEYFSSKDRNMITAIRDYLFEKGYVYKTN